MGGRRLWLLRWVTGTELGSVQAVPHGLCGDVGVGGRLQLPPDAICSGFLQRLGLSGDVVVFPGCGLFGPTWLRHVMDLASGVKALSQPHVDQRGHLKMPSDFSCSYAIMEPCHGSSPVKQAQFSSSNHCVVPWCDQTLAYMG